MLKEIIKLDHISRYKILTVVKKLFYWALILIAVIIPGTLYYSNTKSVIIEQAGTEARGISIAVAALIEENIEDYADLYANAENGLDKVNVVYYDHMLSVFRRIQSVTGASFIFSEKQIDPETVVYILDGTPRESPDFSPLGSKDSIAEIESQVFAKGIPMKTSIVEDPAWGSYITSYAPIYDSRTRQYYGLVGVDISAERAMGFLKNIRLMLYIVVAVLSILGFFAVNWIVDHNNSILNFDYLTKLGSKRAFESVTRDLIKTAERTQSGFTLLLIDLDNFKRINDIHGHVFGDKILTQVAETLKSSTRSADETFRIGGDEFTVLLPGTNKEQAETVRRRIQANACKLFQPLVDQDNVKYSLSIGIKEWKPGMGIVELLEGADYVMYDEKGQAHSCNELTDDRRRSNEL